MATPSLGTPFPGSLGVYNKSYKVISRLAVISRPHDLHSFALKRRICIGYLQQGPPRLSPRGLETSPGTERDERTVGLLFIRWEYRYRYRHSLDFYSTAIQEDAFLGLQTREASRDFAGIAYLLYSGGVPVNEGTIPDSVTGGTRRSDQNTERYRKTMK
ncbi:hypothetical protein HOLleu_34751 [Holothuria leucospilota]|uniref:Uncharacterized protein n=1 Tax=Holothuria leucospilota TaxID=206669 RepID=A0A9Q0YSG9_HOLLE|nr:hypothetical protein HOLleu_34751 [Holothuria leucospilota]